MHVNQKHASLKLDTYQEFLWPPPCRVGSAGHGPAAASPGPVHLPGRLEVDSGLTDLTKGWGQARTRRVSWRWEKARPGQASERGELLTWEKVCKDIRTAFYPKKELLTLETFCTGEVQTPLNRARE